MTRKRRAPARKAAVTPKRRADGRKVPSVIPMISYEEGIAALEWLANAFGFRETARLVGPDGRLSHGQVTD
jgi:hypothetical protein